MKIILSPDSFKGSLTAQEVAQTMAEAIHSIDPNTELHLLPVADGGEGTLESLINTTRGTFVYRTVQDPLHRPIETCFGLLGDAQTVVIEMAKASGLPLLKETERNPLIATTFGTGELIRHGLELGKRQFLIGIGGSATNDGGLGMLRALGMRFLTSDKKEIIFPYELPLLDTIDDSHFDPRIQQCTFTIACDVEHPFIGPNGASFIFGPQKGATDNIVRLLDDALTHFANIIEESGRLSLHYAKGAGAAGGLGGAFLAFFPATLKSGIDVVLDAIRFEYFLAQADLVITGEGKSDAQTLSGKAPFGIQKRASAHGVPTMLISALIEDALLLRPYFTELHAIVDDDTSASQSIAQPKKYLFKTVTRAMRTYMSVKKERD